MGRRDDYLRYQEILESTRDDQNICHRDVAVKLFTEELAENADRVLEFAGSRADTVADGWDRTYSPAVVNGQMSLTEDNYLVLGDSKRVSVNMAKAAQTKDWIDVIDENHARIAASWSAKTRHARRLLPIQDERNCSMWEAEQILQGNDLPVSE